MIQEQDKSHEASTQAEDICAAIYSQSIDRFMIEAILDSYMQELAKKNPFAANEIYDYLEEESYVNQAHQAVFDGLLFSTLVGALDDFAYESALTSLKVVREDHLAIMRLEVFDYGVKVASQSVGGSPLHGRTMRRCKAFKDAVAA